MIVKNENAVQFVSCTNSGNFFPLNCLAEMAMRCTKEDVVTHKCSALVCYYTSFARLLFALSFCNIFFL